ncbi:MAG TPA: FAD:protein FMN transferase [Planctomycetota bacterium]|nr:FAD:protein FMN transferase [Planctomycetota bacterium]
MRNRFCVCHVAFLVSFAACDGQAAQVHQFDGPTMGSTYEVKYVGAVPVSLVRAVVEAELAQFDLAFSNWREDSEIACCNRHASTAPFAASARFLAVLQQALDVAAATEGAFDPTVKPLSDLYRRAKRDPQHRFDERAAAAACERIGWRNVEVRDRAVHKKRPDVELDLDGIVAGACVDAIAQRLDALSVEAFYLQITGEVYCRGEKAPGVPWQIGVEDPASVGTAVGAPIRTLPLRDRALCTSGCYRNAVPANGRVLHHIFDPRTGKGASRGVVSVSVLADSAALADALGTAFVVLGESETLRLLPTTSRLLPTLRRHAEIGVLFLLEGEDGCCREVEVAWPR